ncbi:MAG: hypothetical protein U0230_20570 [Polyangiales bacterium]
MMRRPSTFASLAFATLIGCGGGDSAPFCEVPPPPADALMHAGSDGSSIVLPGGRRLTPAGQHVVLGGFPVEVLPHPTLGVAYVNNLGYAKRAVEVVRLSDGAILEDLVRPEAFHGMDLSPDGKKLYVAGGNAGFVEIYDVDASFGTVTPDAQVPLDGFPVGMEVASDGGVFWVGAFQGKELVEFDRTTLARKRSVTLEDAPFTILELPSRQELYVTLVKTTHVVVIDLATFTVKGTIDVLGGGPMGLETTPDESRVFVTVSDADRVVAVDTATRSLALDVRMGDADLVDDLGRLLPATSPSGMALDAAANRLYLARSGDNAIYVLDPSTLATLGAIPTAWYPTAVSLAGGKLLVTNGKGVGAGPTGWNTPGDAQGKERMSGSMQLVDLATIDLVASSETVRSNLRRPDEVYPVDCGGRQFPVPAVSGEATPIEHIVLIVRENKSYDSELGDLEGTEADPTLLMYGEDVTPNIHALAREFGNHDNFYDDGESSVQGHFWLTSSFVNDYMERVSYFEDYRGASGFSRDPIDASGDPDFGSFFTHLIRHGVDYRVFGEVVGSGGSATAPDGSTGRVFDHIVVDFPGIFFNTSLKDELKAQFVADWFKDNGLPPFSYVLLPNDHTNGLSPGSLTPESMISDNDYGTGLLVDAITHLPEWRKTAIFIVEDDTQGGADHVDLHRSILVVASPWVKRGHTSSVHLSYPSLFRTFEHILGIPPLNRYTAHATLPFDTFTTRPDYRPYTVRARTVPDRQNSRVARTARGADVAERWSQAMSFHAPDSSPELGDVLYFARFGEAPRGSRLRAVIDGRLPSDTQPLLEDDGDADEYERELAAFRMAAARDPRLRARLRGANLPAVDDDD